MGYTQDLVAHWDLSTDNPADICWRGNRYPGTGANVVGHPDGIAGGRCVEFNGNNSNVNVGDVVELNAVEKFTVSFWMNQDVLDAFDGIFYKQENTSYQIAVFTFIDGHFRFYVNNGATTSYVWFDYSTVIGTGSWYHVCIVYDGTQAVADRARIYIDGVPVVLTTNAALPATTADLSGFDATLGSGVNTFDGKFDEFMIFGSALTQLQVADLYSRTRQGRF